MTADEVVIELNKQASDEDAIFLQRFFKTAPGQYGEGDIFIGVRVPQTRKICQQFKNLSLPETVKLIRSPIHEHRLAGLIILCGLYKKASTDEKQKIYETYLAELHAGNINNWDLVDTSCEHIVGEFLKQTNRLKLFELAKSDNLWERRVSIISTFNYIKSGDASTTIEVAEKLLNDKEDLIHKATGWMLREVGKRIDEAILLDFLNQYAHKMPRTCLRYAIEKLPEVVRQHYLSLK